MLIGVVTSTHLNSEADTEEFTCKTTRAGTQPGRSARCPFHRHDPPHGRTECSFQAPIPGVCPMVPMNGSWLMGPITGDGCHGAMAREFPHFIMIHCPTNPAGVMDWWFFPCSRSQVILGTSYIQWHLHFDRQYHKSGYVGLSQSIVCHFFYFGWWSFLLTVPVIDHHKQPQSGEDCIFRQTRRSYEVCFIPSGIRIHSRYSSSHLVTKSHSFPIQSLWIPIESHSIPRKIYKNPIFDPPINPHQSPSSPPASAEFPAPRPWQSAGPRLRSPATAAAPEDAEDAEDARQWRTWADSQWIGHVWYGHVE